MALFSNLISQLSVLTRDARYYTGVAWRAGWIWKLELDAREDPRAVPIPFL